MEIELRQMRQLIAIVEAGGFRAAAERLHIAQPALSVSIRKLEHAVGAPLLNRDSRGASVTAAGAVFLASARQALKLADQGREGARLTAAGVHGRLRIGFVGSAVYRLLPKILPAFRMQHPGVLLDLIEGTTVDLIPAIEDRRLDCAIIRAPLREAPDLEAVELERDRLVAMLPVDHPLAKQPHIDLAALAVEPFVLFSPRTVPGLRAAVDAACAAAGFVPLAAQEVTQSITMVGLVGSGLGVALSPEVIANIAGPHVRFVPLAREDGMWPLRLLAVRRRQECAPALDLFWESCAKAGQTA